MSMRKYVQVASYSFPYEAHIAKSSLEAAYIQAIVVDEHMVNMNWCYSDAVGGVRVLVRKEDEELAREIISADYSQSLNDLVDEDERLCDNCHSRNLLPITIGKRSAFIVFLLLGFPLFFYKRGFQCEECHYIASDE